MLSAGAEHTADRVWTISAASLLAAINTGRHSKDFATFLAQQTEHELPDSPATLISDVTRRAAQLTDLGHARVIGCADLALARSSPTTAPCAPGAIRSATASSPSHWTRN